MYSVSALVVHKIYLRVFKQRHTVKMYVNFSHRVQFFRAISKIKTSVSAADQSKASVRRPIKRYNDNNEPIRAGGDKHAHNAKRGKTHEIQTTIRFGFCLFF